jgi:hypothetical protein
MTKNAVIRLAQDVARNEGWPWQEPVRAVRRRQWMFGPYVWHIRTNDSNRGMNIYLTITDKSGAVLQKGYAPR